MWVVITGDAADKDGNPHGDPADHHAIDNSAREAVLHVVAMEAAEASASAATGRSSGVDGVGTLVVNNQVVCFGFCSWFGRR